MLEHWNEIFLFISFKDLRLKRNFSIWKEILNDIVWGILILVGSAIFSDYVRWYSAMETYAAAAVNYCFLYFIFFSKKYIQVFNLIIEIFILISKGVWLLCARALHNRLCFENNRDCNDQIEALEPACQLQIRTKQKHVDFMNILSIWLVNYLKLYICNQKWK